MTVNGTTKKVSFEEKKTPISGDQQWSLEKVDDQWWLENEYNHGWRRIKNNKYNQYLTSAKGGLIIADKGKYSLS